jgi:hypothetical protein
LAAEVGTGAFIACLLYFLQERSNKSLKDLVKELHEYNETRKRHDESVSAPMLKRINGFLSDFKSQLEIDRDRITNMDPSYKKELVKNWLSGYYNKADLDSAFSEEEKVGELEKESNDVIPYITGDLRKIVRSIIEDIRTLYGLRFDLSVMMITAKDPPEKWVSMSNATLSKIERAQDRINSQLQSQQSESAQGKTASKN